MVLVILEPLVTFVLAALALLGILTTLFFYLVGPPQFPVWTMLALSLGFAVALVPYYALIELLSSLTTRFSAIKSILGRSRAKKQPINPARADTSEDIGRFNVCGVVASKSD
jgi:hypothetical protein